MIARGFLGCQKILTKIFPAILLSCLLQNETCFKYDVKRINLTNFYSNWSIPHFSVKKKTKYEGTVDIRGGGCSEK